MHNVASLFWCTLSYTLFHSIGLLEQLEQTEMWDVSHFDCASLLMEKFVFNVNCNVVCEVSSTF